MKRITNKPRLWTVGLGAGLVGATLLALRYALRAGGGRRLPEDTGPSEFTSRIFHSSFGEVLYHDGGHGMPILFVHGVGVGASSFEWSQVYGGFGTDYRVFAPDLIGFGESRRPARRMTADDHARVLAEFVQAVAGGGPVILVGRGLGAAFCLRMAGQHPDLVKRVFAVMPGNLSGPDRERQPFGLRLASRVRGLNRFLYRNYFAGRAVIRRWLEEDGFADPRGVTDEMVENHFAYARQTGAEHAIFGFLRGDLDADLDAAVAQLEVPLHVVWIRNAQSVSIAEGERLRDLARFGTLDVLERVGLLPALEAPEAVSKLIREILEGPRLVE